VSNIRVVIPAVCKPEPIENPGCRLKLVPAGPKPGDRGHDEAKTDTFLSGAGLSVALREKHGPPVRWVTEAIVRGAERCYRVRCGFTRSTDWSRRSVCPGARESKGCQGRFAGSQASGLGTSWS